MVKNAYSRFELDFVGILPLKISKLVFFDAIALRNRFKNVINEIYAEFDPYQAQIEQRKPSEMNFFSVFDRHFGRFWPNFRDQP